MEEAVLPGRLLQGGGGPHQESSCSLIKIQIKASHGGKLGDASPITDEGLWGGREDLGGGLNRSPDYHEMDYWGGRTECFRCALVNGVPGLRNLRLRSLRYVKKGSAKKLPLQSRPRTEGMPFGAKKWGGKRIRSAQVGKTRTN